MPLGRMRPPKKPAAAGFLFRAEADYLAVFLLFLVFLALLDLLALLAFFAAGLSAEGAAIGAGWTAGATGAPGTAGAVGVAGAWAKTTEVARMQRTEANVFFMVLALCGLQVGGLRHLHGLLKEQGVI